LPPRRATLDSIGAKTIDLEHLKRLEAAECQIGWIPYVLERIDDVWRTHLWSHKDAHPELPSTYYKDRVFSCFFKDSVGVQLLDRIGVDQVMFETDYPHQDGTWPRSQEVARELLAGVDTASVEKILRGNAQRVFGLNLARSGRF